MANIQERVELPLKRTEGVCEIPDEYLHSGWCGRVGQRQIKTLLALKFCSVTEGISALGGTPQARQTFKDFQRRLYVG